MSTSVSPRVKRMLELDKILSKTTAIDGWCAYGLTSNGEIIAGKIYEDSGLSVSKVFPATGRWKEVAERQKAKRESQELILTLTKGDWEEYHRLRNRNRISG